MFNIIVLSFLGIIISNVTAQFTIGPILPNQQIAVPTQVSKQQLLNYLLSNNNQATLGERIDALASTLQHMPPKRNRRVQLADVLKKSALQNLMVAASVCGATAPVSSQSIPEIATQSYVPMSSIASPRNLVVANDAPLVANRDMLSSLLPKEWLSSLLTGEYAPNRAVRIQYN